MVGAKGFEPFEFLVPNHKEKSKLLNWLELPCATLSLTALPLRCGATSPNAFSRSNKHVT